MEPRLQLRVQRYGWDLAAEHYDPAWAAPLAPVTQAVLRLAALQPGQQVLDVACGSGLLTAPAWQAVQPGGGVTGADLSATMLDKAAARVPRGHFVRAGAEELDTALPPAAFDTVLCGLGLMYMPDPGLALSAMVRRLRPGGRLVASVWGERRLCGWAGVFPVVESRVRSDVCPLFFQLGGGRALVQALHRAGLVDVQAQPLQAELHFADADTASIAAFCGGPVALAHSRFDTATRDAARAEYLASIEPWRDGAGYRLPGAFVVATGLRG